MRHNYQNKRIERSKAAVLEETYRHLSRGGLSGVSIDDIARGSGVAKTTIYRHWPNRSALLIDACSRMGSPQETPDLGSLRRDLTRLAGNVADSFQNAAWTKVIPSIIDAADRDERIATMQAEMHRNNMTPFTAVIERARARGEVRDDVSPESLIAMTLGPLFYRKWFSKEPVDRDFLTAVIDAALAFAKPN